MRSLAFHSLQRVSFNFRKSLFYLHEHSGVRKLIAMPGHWGKDNLSIGYGLFSTHQKLMKGSRCGVQIELIHITHPDVDFTLKFRPELRPVLFSINFEVIFLPVFGNVPVNFSGDWMKQWFWKAILTTGTVESGVGTKLAA